METSYFTILWWVLPYIIMNQPWVHMCPPILNPPPTSFPTYSLWITPGYQLLSVLLYASNLHWLSILHMVIYMFQCYSLKSFTLTFSHRVQKSILYICVSFAVSHSIFLSSILYALLYCIGVFLSDLLHCIQ